MELSQSSICGRPAAGMQKKLLEKTVPSFFDPFLQHLG
jgi:hypothetical protein